jgi:YHS domain-containing protein
LNLPDKDILLAMDCPKQDEGNTHGRVEAVFSSEDPVQPPYKVVYEGKAYYFCSETCKLLFERLPDQYIKEMDG